MSVSEVRDEQAPEASIATTYKVILVNQSKGDIIKGKGVNNPGGFTVAPPATIKSGAAGNWSFLTRRFPPGPGSTGSYSFLVSENPGDINWNTRDNPAFTANAPVGHRITFHYDDAGKDTIVVTATFV